MKLAPLVRWCVAGLVLSTTAFVAWVWWSGPREVEPRVVSGPTDGQEPQRVAHQLPPVEDRPDRPQVVRSLADLQPGVPRTAVERYLGAPIRSTQPAVVKNDTVTYCATYRVPASGPQSPNAEPAAPSQHVITLEFDATKPDHPLIGLQGVVTPF